MINLKLDGLTGSKMLEIQAAVLRIMEEANFEANEINTELSEGKEDGSLMMVFVGQEISLAELNALQSGLGEKFSLKILGKSKNDFFLQVSAPKEEFLALGKRYIYRPTNKFNV